MIYARAGVDSDHWKMKFITHRHNTYAKIYDPRSFMYTISSFLMEMLFVLSGCLFFTK